MPGKIREFKVGDVVKTTAISQNLEEQGIMIGSIGIVLVSFPIQTLYLVHFFTKGNCCVYGYMLEKAKYSETEAVSVEVYPLVEDSIALFKGKRVRVVEIKDDRVYFQTRSGSGDAPLSEIVPVFLILIRIR